MTEKDLLYAHLSFYIDATPCLICTRYFPQDVQSGTPSFYDHLIAATRGFRFQFHYLDHEGTV